MEAYLDLIKEAGFQNIIVQKNKPIIIPDDILVNYLNDDEITEYQSKETAIRSITVYAEKGEKAMACTPGGGCC